MGKKQRIETYNKKVFIQIQILYQFSSRQLYIEHDIESFQFYSRGFYFAFTSTEISANKNSTYLWSFEQLSPERKSFESNTQDT